MNSKAILMLTLSNVAILQGRIRVRIQDLSSVGGCLVWHFHIIFEYYMRISISSAGLQQNVCPSIGGFCGVSFEKHPQKGVVRCSVGGDLGFRPLSGECAVDYPRKVFFNALKGLLFEEIKAPRRSRKKVFISKKEI